MATIKWGGKSVVNTKTTGAQNYSAVTATPDGGYLVFWDDGTYLSGTNTDLRGQRFAPGRKQSRFRFSGRTNSDR